MKILLTGATGFLGGALLEALADRGDEVTVALRSESRRQALPRTDVPVVVADLGDPDNLELDLKPYDAVIHVAGLVSDWAPAEKLHRINVEATMALVRLADRDGIGHFVHTSSIGVFGTWDYSKLPEDGARKNHTCPYDRSKYEAELALERYVAEHPDFPLTMIRPGFVYGPQDRQFLPRTIKKVRTRKAKYLGDGNNALTTTYIDNVLQVYLAVLDNPEVSIGEVYNCTDSQGMTLRDLFDTISEEYDYPKVTKRVPKPVASCLATVLEGIYRLLRIKTPPVVTHKMIAFATSHRDVSVEKAKEQLGYEPVSWKEALPETLRQLKEQGIK